MNSLKIAICAVCVLFSQFASSIGVTLSEQQLNELLKLTVPVQQNYHLF